MKSREAELKVQKLAIISSFTLAARVSYCCERLTISSGEVGAVTDGQRSKEINALTIENELAKT